MAVIPTSDVNLATEVRDVLNSAGGSVGNDVTSFFKSAANLNMWSKYKPVVSKTLFYDLSTWQSKGYKGDNGMCGFTIPTFNAVSTFRDAVANGTTFWTYTPPTGGTTQPMRLGDFREYCTDAHNPIADIATNGIKDSSGYVQFDIDVATQSESDTNITLPDISINGVALSSYYLGIYLYSSYGYYFMTGTTPIGNADGLSVKISVGSTGKYNYVPFLASAAQTGTGVVATFIGLNYEPKSVTIVSSSSLYSISVNAYWNSAKTSVTVESITLFNNNSSAMTFSNVAIYIYRASGSAENGSSGSQAASITLSGSWSVPANGHLDVTVSQSRTVAYVDGYSYWVGATSNLNTSIVAWNQIEEQVEEA